MKFLTGFFLLFFLRYNRRGKSQERKVLSQGIRFPELQITAQQSIAPPLSKPSSLPTGSVKDPYQFPSPPNTAGTAKIKRRRVSKLPVEPRRVSPTQTTGTLIPPLPTLYVGPHNIPLFMGAPLPQQSSQTALQYPSQLSTSFGQGTSVPYTTQRYRRRKMEQEQEGIVQRKYVRKTDVVVCNKCKKDRKPPSHRQYFGNWFCQDSSPVTFDEWKHEMVARGYGKKKKPARMVTPPPEKE